MRWDGAAHEKQLQLVEVYPQTRQLVRDRERMQEGQPKSNITNIYGLG